MVKRKIFSLFLCVLLLAAAALPVSAAGEKYVITAAKANIIPEPNAVTSPIAELPRGTVVEITETKNNFGRFTLRSNGLSGWVHMSLLKYIGGPAGNTEGITAIYVKTPPEKTVYIEGEEAFDPAGLQIWASYEEKEDAPVTGYRLYLPSFAAYGEKNVYVSYTAPGGAVFSAEFGITVAKVPIAGLTLLSPPDQTDYIEGQPLDLTGLKVMLRYTDGRADEIYGPQEILENPDFILMGCHSETQDKPLVFGSHTVNIYYKYPEVNCRFTLNAIRRTLVSLQIDTLPDSTVTYSTTQPPDLTGLTLSAEYDNGANETVYPWQCTVLCEPEKFILGDGNKVTVQFEGRSITLDFTLALDSRSGLRLGLPTVLNFILGESIDLTALKVYLTSLSGMEAEVKDYAMGTVDPTLVGTQTIPITYQEFSTVFTLNITPYYQKGDPDGDGKVTANDARLTLRAAVGYVNLAGNPRSAADTDRDGNVTASDARSILRAAVKLDELIDYTGIVLLP